MQDGFRVEMRRRGLWATQNGNVVRAHWQLLAALPLAECQDALAKGSSFKLGTKLMDVVLAIRYMRGIH